MATQTVEIERLAAGGDGLGYINGKVCFVPYGVPKDRLEVEITQQNKKFYRARIKVIVRPSMDRVTPPCPHFTHCGGCQWLHINEETQLSAKEAILGHALQTQVSVTPSRPPLGYRSVVRLHVGAEAERVVVGFVHARKRKIVEIEHCPILAEPLDAALPTLSRLARISGRPDGEIRLTQSDPGPVAFYFANAPLPEAFYRAVRDGAGRSISGLSLVSDGLETRLAGAASIETTGTDNVRFEAPAKSFGQANRQINLEIARTIDHWLSQRRFKSAIELFAGAGNHTITIAPHVPDMRASEIDTAACDAMTRNLHRRRLTHVKVEQGEALDRYRASNRHTDLVVLNPPRTGHLALASAMASGDHRAILYISCNPATLARDLAELRTTGYNISNAKGFDMFPHTAHMEAAVLLERT